MGTLLTLPAARLPFVCRTNESAVLVLFPASSCTVVVAPGSGLMGGGGAPEPVGEPPHATSRAIGLAKTTTPSGIQNPLNLMAICSASLDTLGFAPDGSV